MAQKHFNTDQYLQTIINNLNIFKQTFKYKKERLTGKCLKCEYKETNIHNIIEDVGQTLIKTHK